MQTALFLLLAETVRLPLITADRRLSERMRGTAIQGHVVLLAEWGVEHG